MRPTDALAYRRILLTRCQDLNRLNPDAQMPDDGSAPQWQLEETLPLSDVYYVSADMTAVARTAGKTMPAQLLHTTDLPSEKGFMLWDAPVAWFDFADVRVPIVGVAWYLSHERNCSVWGDPDFPGCTVVAYDPDNPEHVASARMAEEGAEDEHDPPDWIVSGTELEIVKLVKAPDVGELLPIGTTGWWIGSEPADASNNDDDLSKTLLATWTLMGQTIAATTTPRVDRAERRRNKRLELEDMVTVVQLRRLSTTTDDDDQDPTAVSWSHRWLVGGHWRNQWLPSQDTHRLQWISPYVKGPAYLPLVVKERVTAWTR